MKSSSLLFTKRVFYDILTKTKKTVRYLSFNSDDSLSKSVSPGFGGKIHERIRCFYSEN